MTLAGQESRGRGRGGPRAAGFSLTELLVGLAVTVALLVAVLNLFASNTKIARVQTQVAELQNSVRISQDLLITVTRMAGRGGLPARLRADPAANPPFRGRIVPHGAAFEVLNNVPADATIGGASTPNVKLVEGTDVLTVRGVLTTPVYQVDPPSSQLQTGRVTVNALSPSGVPQDLRPLREAVERARGGEPEALILVSPLGPELFAVVELTGGTVETATGNPDQAVRVTADFSAQGGRRTADYNRLTPGGAFPDRLTSAAFVGVLEEYRYFVAADRAIPGDETSELLPRLARARFFPGSQDVHPSNPTAQEIVADGILDLQISIGVDLDGDGDVEEEQDDRRKDDEWLFNHKDDTPDDPDSNPGNWQWNSAAATVFFVRINVLGRTDRPDPSFVAPPILELEDRVYNEPEVPADEPERRDRMARRRLLQTVVDLRNL